jgi:hypothetical protein
MQCCAICGIVKFINKKNTKQDITNTTTHQTKKWLRTINNGKCHDNTQVAIMEISCTFVTSAIQTKENLGMQLM